MRSWYGPDETREPWCFATIASEGDTEESPLTGWAIGVANSEQMISIKGQHSQADRREEDLMTSLAETLDARRYTGTTILTADEQALAHLRRRLVVCSALHSPTLRGFNHIALETILDRYFGVSTVSEFVGRNLSTGEMSALSMNNDGLSTAVEQLWQAWTAVYQLIPAGACVGDPL